MMKLDFYIKKIRLCVSKNKFKKFNIFLLKKLSLINNTATLYLAEYFYFEGYTKKSINYYKRLMLSDNYFDAIFGLARCYWKLALEDENYSFETAVKFYEIIGINDNAIVQYWLGNAYLAEKYKIKNEEKAVFWYKKSADNGVILAKYHLAICYLLGIGCRCDYNEALNLFNECYKNGKVEVDFYIDICKNKIKIEKKDR